MDDIDFVLTVPAIWDDTAKMFMREAAVQVDTYFLHGNIIHPRLKFIFAPFALVVRGRI